MIVARGHIDLKLWGKGVHELAESFPHHPLKAVAVMGFAEFAGNSDPQLGGRVISLPEIDRDQLSKQAARIFIQMLVMGTGQNPGRLRELSVDDGYRHLCSCEFFAAGAATAVDDGPSILGFHPLAESAVFLTFPFAGLISAFHWKFPFIEITA